MLAQENMAEKELVVGSLKVLHGIEGAGYKQVKQTVENLRNSVQNIGSKQEDYWSSLSADGVISSIEKKQLKKEFEGIDQTHTALMRQAEDKGVITSDEVQQYDYYFDSLHDYLYVTLKLFDNMSEATPIESAEVFNKYYNDYYFSLQNAQAKVNIGEPGKIRYLSSLLEEGYNDEVAIYENQFYKYNLTKREWENIQVASKLGEYMGVLTESPPQILNQYFLVGPSGIATDYIVWTGLVREAEENAWTDENGNVIYINYGFETGFIYYWSENNEFVKVEDKNNWRYIIAMNDMIACHYEVSPQLYEWLTGELAENIGGILEGNVLNHVPKYKRVSAIPENSNDGDWILWDAPSTARFSKGHLYVYQKETVSWIELNPLDESGEVRSKFMTALSDILEVNPTETGYFSTVFAQAFFSNTATINKLSTYEFILEDSGYMKSKGFVSGSSGWIIHGNGNAQFNNITIAGYATDSALQNVKTTAENAENAAATADEKAVRAKSAADTADEKAENAGTAANDAQTSVNNVINGNTGLSGLHGEILRDVSDPDSWAIRTANFDPFTSEKGFGITKSGSIYAKNGIFSGILNCGTLQVQLREMKAVVMNFPVGTAAINVYRYIGQTFLEPETGELWGTYIFKPKEHFYYGSYRITKVTNLITDPSGGIIVTTLYYENTVVVKLSNYSSQGKTKTEAEVKHIIDLGEKLVMVAEDLPTEKPIVPDIIWNDNGTLKVS